MSRANFDPDTGIGYTIGVLLRGVTKEQLERMGPIVLRARKEEPMTASAEPHQYRGVVHCDSTTCTEAIAQFSDTERQALADAKARATTIGWVTLETEDPHGSCRTVHVCPECLHAAYRAQQLE